LLTVVVRQTLSFDFEGDVGVATDGFTQGPSCRGTMRLKEPF
jgi:hypothetical protein